jgi:transposase
MLTLEQTSSMDAVGVDGRDPYVTSIQDHLPEGEEKSVFDQFHIAGHLGEAVDKVLRTGKKVLVAEGDTRLIGTKCEWLRYPTDFTWEKWAEFKTLLPSTLQTARAWALKETVLKLYDYTYETPDRKHFRWLYHWATHSRLEPMIALAEALKGRFDNIITYLKHPITNATGELLNAKIQRVMYTARGFRNKQNFTTAIYFHCGALDLDPLPT